MILLVVMDKASRHPTEGIASELFTPEAPIDESEIVPTRYVEDLINSMLDPAGLGIEASASSDTGDIRGEFDWPDVLDKVGKLRNLPPDMDLDLHLIVFRSTYKSDMDTDMAELLDAADMDAFREAMYKAPSAFLYYYREAGRSFCLWTDIHEARRATKGLAHDRATVLAPLAYETAKIEAYKVSRLENGSRVEIEDKYTVYPLEHAA